MTPNERILFGRRAALFYQAVRKAQAGDPEVEPMITEFLEIHSDRFVEAYSPSEAAWRAVSLLVYGHDGRHKFLSNLVSEVAPLTE